MKRVCLLGMLFLVSMALPWEAAAGAEVKISDKTRLDFGFSLQTLGRATDFRNPNSRLYFLK
jgi:hypothetical protein